MDLQFDRDFTKLVTANELVVLNDVSLAQLPPLKTGDALLYLIYTKRGLARIRYEESELHLEAGTIACFLPKRTTEMQFCSDNFRAMIAVMSDNFLTELKQHTFTHNFKRFHFAPVAPLTEQQAEQAVHILATLKTISEFNATDTANRHELLLFQAVVAYEWLNITLQPIDGHTPWDDRQSDIFNRFCELLAANYQNSREVKFYADLLYLSPKYFSNVIRQTTGIPAGKWIDDYVVTHAKRILSTRTDITIQEIGYRLGFPEPASFIHFFKRTTGMTPKEYRKTKSCILTADF